MLDDALRPIKDRWLSPCLPWLAGVSPLTVTLVGFGVGLLAAALAGFGHYPTALAAFLGNRLLDGLDGALARARGKISDLGGYLDLLLDFVVYAALPVALAAGRGQLGLPLALLLAAFYVNGASWMLLSPILERRGAARSTTVVIPAGLIGGTETILFYGAFLLWPALCPALFLTMAALVTVGAAQRALWAWRNLR